LNAWLGMVDRLYPLLELAANKTQLRPDTVHCSVFLLSSNLAGLLSVMNTTYMHGHHGPSPRQSACRNEIRMADRPHLSPLQDLLYKFEAT
jgi:hypothetical protein